MRGRGKQTFLEEEDRYLSNRFVFVIRVDFAGSIGRKIMPTSNGRTTNDRTMDELS